MDDIDDFDFDALEEAMEELVTIPDLPITPQNFYYWYKGVVTRIVDGDSYRIDVDHGRKIYTDDTECRGYGYDTWETRRRPTKPPITDEQWEEHKVKGKEATAFVEEVMPVGTQVTLVTYKDKDGKYGRLLIQVYIPSGDQWIDLTASLEKNGHLKS